MHPVFQFLVVVLVFLGIYFSLVFVTKLLSKRGLYNIKGLLFGSFLLGAIFGAGSFILILISQKFQHWSLSSKLIYAGEIFLWVFFGGLILFPIAFRRAKDYVQKDKQKMLEK